MMGNSLVSFIIDQTHYGIITIDRVGRITVCNATAQKMFDLPQPVLGKLITSLTTDTVLIDIINSNRSASAERCVINGKTYVVNRVPLEDVPQMDLQFSENTLMVFQDVSEMEGLTSELEAFRRINEELEGLIEYSHDGIIVTDGKGTVLRINDSILRVTNLIAEHFLGKKIDSLYTNGCFYTEPVAKLARINKEVTTGITKIRTGKEVLVVSTPVLDDLGEVVRVVTNVRDLSEINYIQQRASETGVEHQDVRDESQLSMQEELIANGMITGDRAMLKTLGLTKRVSNKDVTVLLQGESGVGKEVFAGLIHYWSKRKGPLIKVNCGAIPGALLESELFGYCGGAFTGANKDGKPGLFELANQGTLFLDEISDLPLDLQGKLLRVIQEQEFVRLGGTKVIRVNVRLVAASNRDLAKMVQQQTFRIDLFYRLNVVPIQITPLRDRKEDIVLLADHFLDKFNRKHGTRKVLSPGLKGMFVDYPWPGNIRELMNMIERLVITIEGNMLDESAFSTAVKSVPDIEPESLISSSEPEEDTILSLKEAIEDMEKSILAKALKKYKRSRKVGQALGISHTAVLKKIKKYNLIS